MKYTGIISFNMRDIGTRDIRHKTSNTPPATAIPAHVDTKNNVIEYASNNTSLTRASQRWIKLFPGIYVVTFNCIAKVCHKGQQGRFSLSHFGQEGHILDVISGLFNFKDVNY